LQLLELEGRLGSPEGLAETFVDVYADAGAVKPEKSELNWWAALALFLLSVGPFRRLEPDWPEKTVGILEAAEHRLC